MEGSDGRRTWIGGPVSQTGAIAVKACAATAMGVGLRKPRVPFACHENEISMRRDFVDQAVEMLAAMGAEVDRREPG